MKPGLHIGKIPGGGKLSRDFRVSDSVFKVDNAQIPASIVIITLH